MANRRFEQFQLSLEKAIVTLYGQVAIGSTGAPTLSTAKSKGILSIARTATGKYTITLSDIYQRLVGFDYTYIVASGAPGTTAVASPVVRADNSASATPTIVVEFLDNTGTANEIASGVTLLIQIQLKNSVV